jgi:hypothetical protein
MHLHQRLRRVLGRAATGDVAGAQRDAAALARSRPLDRRDALLALLALYDVHLAPLAKVGSAAALQHDPELARLKADLEAPILADLDVLAGAGPDIGDELNRSDPVAALRSLARIDLVPALYRWLAERAGLDELRTYLALEGGPDGGFDDLVAVCQVGITGRAKVELGRNYWDEMGRGELGNVHSQLHADMASALALDLPPVDEVPVAALQRAVLGPLLATNRVLQPEMIGALGFIELQAGPRSREVARGLRRLGAPTAALPFYDEHATADPRHGKAWLDEVVAPLVEADPAWGPRILRGARWRAAVNRSFFAWAATELGIEASAEVAEPLALSA